MSQVTCYACGQKGHLANDPKCPKHRSNDKGSGGRKAQRAIKRQVKFDDRTNFKKRGRQASKGRKNTSDESDSESHSESD